MKSQASHALVGLFALAVVAGLFGFVYWFNTGSADKMTDVRLIFNDKVSGLARGTSVLFNGLQVGEVTHIGLQPDDPRQIYAVIRVDRSAPLRVDTRARVEAQGLAGVAAVQLLGGDPNSPVLTKLEGNPFRPLLPSRLKASLKPCVALPNAPTRHSTALKPRSRQMRDQSAMQSEIRKSFRLCSAAILILSRAS
ncbi:MlaD family protein [Bosea sp. 124]|uniref:MlaD family protein n=1 Tax=Bosea sp. 124 TaxID=2135642 RepID=UPI000D37596E|nr:MlaD family protein [Bosea sp. 124]